MEKKYFLIFLLFTVLSCNILKKSDLTRNIKISQEQLIDSVVNNYLEYNSLYYKFDAEILNGEQNLKFGGNLKIRQDSAILISISPVGFEVGRALFTKDSIIVLNKIQNQFFSDDYEYLLIKHNIFLNYNILQNILTNNLFYYSANLINFKNVDFTSEDSLFIINQLYSNDLITYNQKTYINNENFYIQNIVIQQINTDNILNIKYSDFIMISDSFLPSKISINLTNDKLKYTANFNISKILYNKDLKFNSEIPDNYVRIWF